MMLLMMLLNKNRLLDDTSRDFDDRKTTKISIPLFFFVEKRTNEDGYFVFFPLFCCGTEDDCQRRWRLSLPMQLMETLP